MWQIKNEILKEKVAVWFNDEEIDSACRGQMNNESLGIVLTRSIDYVDGNIRIFILKDKFELTYDPNGWNPYPEVSPPHEGDWLVQDKNGDYTIREFHATYGPEGCDEWWKSTPAYYPEPVAFRALPEKYVR